jgi:Lar family restriction alleviation protein
MPRMPKPCPFCGSTNIQVSDAEWSDGKLDYFGLCLDCGAHGPPRDDPEAAAGSWDTRSPEGEPQS